jgi:tyrosyl-tRNA synthetase
LQRTLAQDLTTRVHGADAYQSAVEASNILFGKSTADSLRKLDEKTFLEVFDGVPQFPIHKDSLSTTNIVDLLAEQTQVFASKSEARRALKDNGVSINKNKVNEQTSLSANDLISNRYIVVQKGKKNYALLVCEN